MKRKRKLFGMPILGTLICIGPYGNLLLDIINKDYSNILITAIMVFPSLILMTLVWAFYFYVRIKYPDEEDDGDDTNRS